MPIPILMPALSPTMEHGTLARWLVKEGDQVVPGDVIAEIETDKATMEVEAVDEGTVARLLVAEGTEGVPVNRPIALLLEEGEDAAALDQQPEAARDGQPQAARSEQPPATKGPETTTTPGAPAAAASQAPSEAPSPPPAPGVAGPASHEDAASDEGAAQSPEQHWQSNEPAGKGRGGRNGRIFASPLARRLARQAGIALARIAGSGPHGRIIKRDVEAALAAGGPAFMGPPEEATSDQTAPRAMATVERPSPTLDDEKILALYEPNTYELVPHDNMRKVIARRLVEAKATIPHFYLTIDCRLDELLRARKRLNEGAHGQFKLSVNDFLIKALALALQKVPDANATWTERGLLKHQRSDVGVAVAVEGGLFTPIIRHADLKTLSEISNEMKELAARARKRRLAPHEYQGGTTAISNLGMYGIKRFDAVINPPHATILAVGAAEARPIVVDGKIEVATMMSCTLSCDHRVIDGALGADLLAAFKALVEDPVQMLV